MIALQLALAYGQTEVHAAPQPIVRASLSTPRAGVGEAVNLEISVLVPGWFAAPVALPASIEVTGAHTRLSERSGPHLNESIAGVAYAGVRRNYTLIPQRAGTIEIPSIELTFAFADGERTVDVRLASPALTLEARTPPGMETLGYFIASPQYRLEQHFDRELEDLRVGDAVVRTLTQRAVQFAAVQMPSLTFTPIPGIASYADDPVFEDRRGERSVVDVATQTQRITYLLQEPGDYELPDLTVRWLNTRSQQVETAHLPAVKFRVAPDPEAGAGSPTDLVAAAGPAMPSDAWPARKTWLATLFCTALWLGLRMARLHAARNRGTDRSGAGIAADGHRRNASSRFRPQR
jgi:hypothetical protein